MRLIKKLKGQFTARDKKKLIIIVSAVALALILIIVAGIYYFAAVKSLKDDYDKLKFSITACLNSLKTGDTVLANAAISDLDATSSKMRSELNDGKWALPRVIPPVSEDLDTAIQALDIVDKASDTILKPASDAIKESGMPQIKSVTLDNMGPDLGKMFYAYSDVIDKLCPALTDVMNDLDQLPKFNIGMLENKISKYRAFPDATEQFMPLIKRAPDELLRPAADVMSEKPFSKLKVKGGMDTSIILSYIDLGMQIKPFIGEIDLKMKEGNLLERIPELKKLSKKLDDISSYMDELERYEPLMKALVGDGKDKFYLVVAQNSAELRACGGFPGSVGTATVKNNILKFGDFKTVYDVIPQKHGSSIKFSEAEVKLFHEDWYVAKARSASANPDFPRCAEIWAAAYGRNHKKKPDGVISLTPHIIQRLMPITGPVTLSNGKTLDENYCIWYLQHDVYFEYFGDPKYKGKANDITDGLFAETATKVEDKLLDKPNVKNMLKLLEVLEESSKDRVFMIWMKDEEEQKIVKDLGFDGGMNDDPENPEIGVYYSIKAANKLGPYVSLATKVGKGELNKDGSMSYDVTVELSNTIDDETLDLGRYNGYITSTKYGGNMKSVIYFFAPAGGKADSFKNDAPYNLRVKKTKYNGLEVGYASEFFVYPGMTIVFNYTVTTAPGVTKKPSISVTPTLTEFADSKPAEQQDGSVK